MPSARGKVCPNRQDAPLPQPPLRGAYRERRASGRRFGPTPRDFPQFAPLSAQLVAIVRQNQVVVAQALTNVAGQNGHTWQRHFGWSDQLRAVRRVRHQRQIGQ